MELEGKKAKSKQYMSALIHSLFNSEDVGDRGDLFATIQTSKREKKVCKVFVAFYVGHCGVYSNYTSAGREGGREGGGH